MRYAAAILAAALSFLAGVWFMRQYRYHVPALEPVGDGWYIDGDGLYIPPLVCDDWATDPRTTELATGGGR